MNNERKLLSLVLVALLGSSAVVAAETEEARRDRMAEQLVDRWSGHVEGTYKMKARDWEAAMKPLLREVPMEDLELAAAAGSFDAMNDTLLGQESQAERAAGAKLGALDNELVYMPVTPCRLFDTRLAGGIIAAKTERSFDVTAVSDYSFQGGSGTNCGIGGAGSFAAAVINITAVTPSNIGFVTAYPYGTTRPLAANLVVNPGQLVSNEVVIKLDQGASANEMTVYASTNTHLVGDVTGYFMTPTPYSLSCAQTAFTNTPVAAGGTANSTAPACPAGTVQTATNCESSTWQMPFVYFSAGTCSAQNNSGAAATLRSGRTCCSVVE